MSDDWIILVPRETGFVPQVQDQDQALKAFRGFAPTADEILVVIHQNIELFDCGANFETVKCPNCDAVINFEWWSKKMSDDYRPKYGFHFQTFQLACCQHQTSLDALHYEWPQAFGRFGLSGMNCNIGRLTSNQIETLSGLLNSDVTVVYQHL